MPATVPAVTLIATKVSPSGNFRLVMQHPVGGGQRELVINSLDMATIAALGSGSSATFNYPEDQNRQDYDRDITFVI